MAKGPGIPPEHHDEVRRRAAAGESNRTIAAWLRTQGVEVAHTTVGRFLLRGAGTSNSKKPPARADITPGSTPRHSPKRLETGNQPAICGEPTKYNSRCRFRAGQNTDHEGVGPCRTHDGVKRPGAPLGNQNAVRTGERRSIYLDALTADEQAAWARVDPDPSAAIDDEIKLLAIRLRGGMKELARLERIESDLVTVEEHESRIVRRMPKFADDDTAQEAPAPTTYRSTTKRTIAEQKRLAQDAVTRMQGRMVQALRLKHRIAQDVGEGDKGDFLADLADLLEGSTERED